MMKTKVIGLVVALLFAFALAAPADALRPPPPKKNPEPVIGAEMIGTPDPVVRGAPVTYQLTISNSGSVAAGDVDFYVYPAAGETFDSVDTGLTGWKVLNDAPPGIYHIDSASALRPQQRGTIRLSVKAFPTGYTGIGTHKVTLGWVFATGSATRDVFLHFTISDSTPVQPPDVMPPPPTATPAPPPSLTAAERAGFAAITQFADSADRTYFPETRHSLGNDNGFKRYWATHGGLRMFGLPLSEDFVQVSTDGQSYITQYFERAVFEAHPANADPYKVQLRLLGNLSGQHQSAVSQQLHDTAFFDYYAQTGHWLGGLFRDYWNANGGLAQFGYPIGEPYVEGAKVVQWFERQRIEITGGVRTIDQMTLGLAGKEDAQRRGLPLTVS